MPIYEYKNTLTGMVEERICRFEDRDRVPPHLVRICVPRRVNVCFSNAPIPQNVQVLHGLKRYEQQIGTSALERSVGWKADDLKRIWSEPD